MVRENENKSFESDKHNLHEIYSSISLVWLKTYLVYSWYINSKLKTAKVYNTFNLNFKLTHSVIAIALFEILRICRLCFYNCKHIQYQNVPFCMFLSTEELYLCIVHGDGK